MCANICGIPCKRFTLNFAIYAQEAIPLAANPYNVKPNEPFAVAARHALEIQFRELMANLPGTIAGDDIEALHDMRVASRRLRAAMSVFGTAFKPSQFIVLEKEVAKVTDALGAVRDSDVLIEFLDSELERSQSTHKIGLSSLISEIDEQRTKQRIELVRELEKLARGKFTQRMTRMLGSERTV